MKILGALIPVAIFIVSCTIMVSDGLEDPFKSTRLNRSTLEYLQAVLRAIKEQDTNLQTAVSKMVTDFNKLTNLAGDWLNTFDSKIGEAIDPLVVALDATKATVPTADLSKGEEHLQTLITKATNETKFDSVFDAINQWNYIVGELQTIQEQFKTSATQLTQNYFETQCKMGSVTDWNFSLCVEGIYKKFQNVSQETENKINNIYLESYDDRSGFYRYWYTNFDFQTIYNLSIEIGNIIYVNNNITEQDILNYGLKFNTYNITPILETISVVDASAKELDKRNTVNRNNGNSTLFASGAAIYDIVGPGRVYCNQKAIEERLQKGRALVAERTNYVFSKAPVLSPTIAELFQRAFVVNATLQNALYKLNKRSLNYVCPLSTKDVGQFFLKYLCLVKEVNKFGVYYEAELKQIKNYSKDALEKLSKGKEALEKWRTEFVSTEAAGIVYKLKLESESFYNQCNITVGKLINFALFVAQLHYANFQQSITSTYAIIVELADIVISRTYTGYSIKARLELATEPLTTAIDAVLASKNSSVITNEVYLAKSKLFQDAELQFEKVLANFSVQSKLYKQISSSLLQIREEIQLSVNYSNLNSICYKTSSWVPLTDLINCALGQVYSRVFVQGNNRTLTTFNRFKDILYGFKQNATAIIQEGADIIVEEYTKDIYYFAYKLYVKAGLKVPYDVLKKSGQNRCVRAVKLTKYYCVVIT